MPFSGSFDSENNGLIQEVLMNKIRFGIIGTGGIASKFAQALSMSENAVPAAVSSRNEENGKRFADQNGIGQIYVGAGEMVQAPDLDVIYVATPHPFHFENCMLALKAGKHVLCEKPMVTKKADAEALFAEAKKNHVLLMEGMWSRFLPNVEKAKEWIDSGRIGKVTFIDGIFSFAVDERNPKPRLVDPKLGGGSLWDLGVYTVEMASYFAGANPLGWEGLVTDYCYGTDGAAVMALSYSGDILATLRTGIVCDAPAKMTILGTKGRIELPRFYLGNEVRLYEGNELKETLRNSFELPEGFLWEIEAVVRYVREGITESPVVKPEDTIATTEILEGMMHRFYPELY